MMKVPASLLARRAIIVAASALFVATLALLLFGSYCSFSWGEYDLRDYGIYTNMLWNSAHGAPFRFLMAKSYLKTHLSFTLLLVAPLFRLWDHPLLPMVLQWILLIAGSGVIWWTAARHRFRGEVIAALLFFYAGYTFMQAVQLTPFHGVMLYVLLFPWLYYCLCFRKDCVWLPFLLVLGLREDASLMVLPMLLYFAVRDKWKAGYVYSAVALVYGVAALAVLFPAVSGGSVADRRDHMMSSGAILGSFNRSGLKARGLALAWVFLPALPFLRRKGWIPVVVFLVFPLIMTMGSGYWRVYTLKHHYPAAVMVFLALGLVEALARAGRQTGGRWSLNSWIGAVYLLAVTLAAHAHSGYLAGGGKCNRVFTRVHADGPGSLKARKHLPREGVLYCPSILTGACANRRDLVMDEGLTEEGLVDAAFFRTRDLVGKEKRPLLELLRGKEFGVTYFDGQFVIMERGRATDRNREVLLAVDAARRTLEFHRTLSAAGDGTQDVRTADGTLVRRWTGDGARAPVIVAHGRAVTLKPGAYEARFRFRAESPRKNVRNSWGTLALHVFGQEANLAEADIEPLPCAEGEFRTQVLVFEASGTWRVEPIVVGCDAELWLDRVTFVPLDAEADVDAGDREEG